MGLDNLLGYILSEFRRIFKREEYEQEKELEDFWGEYEPEEDLFFGNEQAQQNLVKSNFVEKKKIPQKTLEKSLEIIKEYDKTGMMAGLVESAEELEKKTVLENAFLMLNEEISEETSYKLTEYYEKTIPILEQLDLETPTLGLFQYLLAQRYLLRSQKEDTQQAYNMLLKATNNPTNDNNLNSMIYLERGIITKTKQDIEKAYNEFQKAAEYATKSVNYNVYMKSIYEQGLILLEKNQTEDALHLQTQALKVEENVDDLQVIGQVHYLTGTIYSRLEKPENAVHHLKKAAKYFRENYQQLLPMALYSQGVNHYKMNEYQQAKNVLLEALECDFWADTGEKMKNNIYEILTVVCMEMGLDNEAQEWQRKINLGI